ncbi:MAG: SGNH/GDSL hydrolase family protein [Gemmatimonadaceae bacterium]
MSRSAALLFGGLAIALVSACADAPPSPVAPPVQTTLAARGDGDDDGTYVSARRLARYVALGTSVSMGVADAGILFSAQQQSWPAQLARLAGTQITEPLIGAPGCAPPLLAPLATGRRINGDPAAGSNVCAGLLPGVTLPVANVAIDGSITQEALSVTPEIAGIGDPFRGALFSRVLRPGHTQVTEMIAQHPKFVSVELGANELLRGRAGILIPGLTFIPYAAWQADYDRVVAAVRSTRARALLIGLARELDVFPSFRRGRELWAARAQFEALYVKVSAGCDGADRDNVLFVYPIILRAVAEAQAAAAAGRPMPVLSCADVPGTVDFILTPSDVAVLNGQMVRMNAHIQSLAAENGYAFMQLGALYDRADLKGPLDVRSFLFSPQPFGALISLDGIHPSAAGHAILAEAAARAIGLRRDEMIASTDGH